MKKLTQLILLIALVLSMTTLSASETVTSINQAEAVLDQVGGGEAATVLDTVDIGQGIEIVKDAFDGDGFNWQALVSFLVPLLMLGSGWLLERWKSKNKSVFLAATYEGAQATSAYLDFIDKPSKRNLEVAVREAKDVVVVPKTIYHKVKRE